MVQIKTFWQDDNLHASVIQDDYRIMICMSGNMIESSKTPRDELFLRCAEHMSLAMFQTSKKCMTPWEVDSIRNQMEDEWTKRGKTAE